MRFVRAVNIKFTDNSSTFPITESLWSYLEVAVNLFTITWFRISIIHFREASLSGNRRTIAHSIAVPTGVWRTLWVHNNSEVCGCQCIGSYPHKYEYLVQQYWLSQTCNDNNATWVANLISVWMIKYEFEYSLISKSPCVYYVIWLYHSNYILDIIE